MAAFAHFLRSTVAYLSANAALLEAGVPRFDVGRFFGGSRALVIEANTTNLLTENQSNVSTDTTGFTPINGPQSGVRDLGQFFLFPGSFRTICSLTAFSGYAVEVTTSVQATYIGRLRMIGNPSVYDYPTDSFAYALHVVYTDASIDSSGFVATPNAQWQDLITGPVTSNPAKTVATVRLVFRDSGGALLNGMAFWVDALQIERQKTVTSWHIGGATRGGEQCLLPNRDLFAPESGTVEAWVYVTQAEGPQTIWDTRHVVGVLPERRCYLVSTAGLLSFTYWNGTALRTLIGGNLVAEAWTHVAVSWGKSGGKIYTNGIIIASHDDLPVLDNVTRMTVGSRIDNFDHLNGKIGGLRFTRGRQRLNAEILAAYNSNIQFTEDGADSTVFTFNGTMRALLSSYTHRIVGESAFLQPVTVTASTAATNYPALNSADWEFPLLSHRTIGLVQATLVFDFGSTVNFRAVFIALGNWEVGRLEVSPNNSFWAEVEGSPLSCGIDPAGQHRKWGGEVNASGRYVQLTITAQPADAGATYFETPLVVFASDLDAFEANSNWGTTISVDYVYQSHEAGAHEEVQAQGKQYATMQIRGTPLRGGQSEEWQQLAALGQHRKFLVFLNQGNLAESYLMRLDGSASWEEQSGYNSFTMTWKEHIN